MKGKKGKEGINGRKCKRMSRGMSGKGRRKRNLNVRRTVRKGAGN